MGAPANLKSSAGLWVGILVPPLAWAADETISYAATKWACGHQAGIALHALTLTTLGAIAAAATISLTADRENERARFMSVLGLMLSALFIVLVIATAVPKWVLNVCQ